ncbi:right-handed parallel beta-helix repeat-containing protein, partial [Georgenia sp. 10Sc9-8]|nr:right-handed parallel beta-helix repeat-containing protein [Georgenia halotolerans]
MYVGDFDGNRTDSFTVRRGIEYHVANRIRAGEADRVVVYGRAGDGAIVGDWNGDGVDSLGLRRGPDTPGSSVASVRAGGQPSGANTGVPAGVSLREHRGDLTITEPGTVIEGLDVHGYVRVRAKDVVIRNSIIRGGVAGKQDGLVRVVDAGASLLIEDSELVAANPNPGINGLRGWGITARRVNIHGVIDGGHFWGDDVTIEDSWIHDLLHYEDDPYHSDGSHDDGIQIQKGSNIRIVGNTIEGAYNAAIMITQDQDRTSDVTISGNWLDGGKCTVNLSEKGRGPFQGI